MALYKEDIKWIKKSIPTKTERYTDCRRLLLVLIYTCRKCNADSISIIPVDKYNHLLLQDIQINENYSEVLSRGVHYRDLTGIVKDKIREKVTSSVKNDCA